ncbi:DUF4328 domain-containing protein [Tepidiforma sp.]|uniref:DUF4328 domain-containing protein n=1 Tax=Tepidiforma sp. TaxID=2682230 RepID=UPI002ADD79A9|nr:DUF4328 domain-containing protein [Tepidiforma sp.]
MYCPSCTSWSAESAAFCWKCGLPLRGQTTEPPPPPPASGSRPVSSVPFASRPAQALHAPPPSPYPTPTRPPSVHHPPLAGSAIGTGWTYRSASGLAGSISGFAVLIALTVGLGATFAFIGLVVDDTDPIVIGIAISLVGVFATLLQYPLLIVWTRRITGNLLPFQADLRFGTGWAIAAWFIPILSLWYPIRIWNQAWRATRPDLVPPIGWKWEGWPAPTIHAICWMLNFIGSVVWLNGVPTLDPEAAPAPYLQVAGGWLWALANLLLIFVVQALTSRQDTYARQYLPNLSPSSHLPPAPFRPVQY